MCIWISRKAGKDREKRVLKKEGVMHRRRFLKAVGLAAAGVGCGTMLGASRDRMNVVLILTDDQRAGTIRALGNPHIVTPTMDEFVRSGTSFTNAYILGSSKSAVCAPSRAMLLTGRSFLRLPQSVNVPWSVPEEEHGRCPFTTMPEVFRSAGYATFGTGKWHNGPILYHRGFTHGDAIFFGGMGDHYRLPLADFEPSGDYLTNAQRKKIGKERKKQPAGPHATNLFTDAAVRFIEEHDDARPFFMYVSYTAPHDPRTAPKKYREMYDDTSLPVPENFMPEHPFDNGELRGRDERLAKWPRTPAEIRKHLGDYYAMISHIDAQVGRIVDAVRRAGRLEQTLFVLAGDNGLALGQHGLMGKQNLYEHGIRVPLVFRGPGVPKNVRRSTLCYLHDVFPTVCDMAELDTPATVDSRSLADAICCPDATGRHSLSFVYRDLQRAVRDERYKLIEYTVKGTHTVQLFDLSTDPWETNNLADDPDYEQHVNRLRAMFNTWYADETAGSL